MSLLLENGEKRPVDREEIEVRYLNSLKKHSQVGALVGKYVKFLLRRARLGLETTR